MTVIDDVITGALTHHGIKGMKWGVRKSPEELANSNRKEAKKHLSKAIKAPNPEQAAKHEAAAKALLTDHGKEKVSTIKATPVKKKETSAGQKFVQDLVKNQAKRQVNIAANKASDAAVKKLVEVVTKK